MNQNLEKIRLKNGEEYPLSPAYFDGTIVPFEVDLSSAERMTISIAMDGDPVGDDPIEMDGDPVGDDPIEMDGDPVGDDPIEIDGVKISDQVISMETLQKYTYGKVNISVPGYGEEGSEIPMMQIFENLQDMMEGVDPDFAAFDIHSVPGYGAFLHPIFSLVMATEAGTFNDTLGVVTITVPSVGTYLVIYDVFPPVGTMTGELHFGEYHIPEGYLQANRAVEELYPTRWTYGEELSLFANPILYAAFNRAYRAAKPIRLHILGETKTYGDFENGRWKGSVFYDSSSRQLRREVVGFMPKEEMYVNTSITSGTFSVEVNAEVYEEKAKGNYGKLVFRFDGTDWTLDDNVVALSDYGITLDGSPTEGDSFTASLHGDSWGIGSEFICTIPQQA